MDNLCTNPAGLFAVGVAFCPTTPPDPSRWATVVGYAHLGFAGLPFSMLAVIALVLFTKTDCPGGQSPRSASATSSTGPAAG